jgi:competence protein ComGC
MASSTDWNDVVIVILIINTVLLAFFLYNLFKAKSQIDSIASESFKLMVTRLENMVEFYPKQMDPSK